MKVAVEEFDGVAAVAADSDSESDCPSLLTLQKVMLTLTLPYSGHYGSLY